jgi:hypothetical protein
MPAPSTYQSFTIFLSSPGDVRAERDCARDIIDAVNKTIRDILHINFYVQFWEALPPQTPAPSEGTIQDVLNKRVEKSHIFLLLLNKRYGSVEPGHTKSNTEREIDTILERHTLDPRVTILSYFRSIADNADPRRTGKKTQRTTQEIARERPVF